MTQAGRTGLRDFDNGSSGSGRISGCTVGADHWTSRFSPCDDIGNTKMNNVDGSTISNSTTLLRGYKPGQGHRNNGGAASDAKVAEVQVVEEDRVQQIMVQVVEELRICK